MLMGWAASGLPDIHTAVESEVTAGGYHTDVRACHAVSDETILRGSVVA